MRLKKNANLKSFLFCVKNCRYDVYYETQEGDRLNLKSTLSEYIFAASAVDQVFLERGTIVCDDEADFKKIAAYVESVD